MELEITDKSDRLISFCITVCNESVELDKLLTQLSIIYEDHYEIIIQGDLGNVTSDVIDVVQKHKKSFRYFEYIEFPLNNNFAEFKNNLSSYAKGDWIFQIDADEYLSEKLLVYIDELVEDDSSVDAYYISRINTVSGITLKEVDAWKWHISRLPKYTTKMNRSDMGDSHYKLVRSSGLVLKDSTENLIHFDTPIINWPDHQCRLYRNDGSMTWENKVHERLVGSKQLAYITDPDWSIVHKKTLKKQIKQNKFYTQL